MVWNDCSNLIPPYSPSFTRLKSSSIKPATIHLFLVSISALPQKKTLQLLRFLIVTSSRRSQMQIITAPWRSLLAYLLPKVRRHSDYFAHIWRYSLYFVDGVMSSIARTYIMLWSGLGSVWAAHIHIYIYAGSLARVCLTLYFFVPHQTTLMWVAKLSSYTGKIQRLSVACIIDLRYCIFPNLRIFIFFKQIANFSTL